ncbi:MAG TPA: hypothetical protein PLA44_04880 [Propionibacteriaceae bacterium]|nr:hypothetical protein [Propionibacteriaceae bacterium]
MIALVTGFQVLGSPNAVAAAEMEVTLPVRAVVDPDAGQVLVTQSTTITHRRPTQGNSYYYYLVEWATTSPPVPATSS